MDEPQLHNRYTVIFANGDLIDGPAVRQAIAGLHDCPNSMLMAADGGARHALHLGLVPQIVMGDFDSLTEAELDQLDRSGAVLKRFSTHKDETDLELVLLEAAKNDANPIRVIGAIGDRLDQTLANVYLFALPKLRGRDVKLVSGKQTAWLAYPGETIVNGQVGDTLSLLPLIGQVRGVTTDGLEYPLYEETLKFGPARGISNVLQHETARVSLKKGMLLLIHTIGRA